MVILAFLTAAVVLVLAYKAGNIERALEDEQPDALSVAYLKPINHRENEDFVADSIKALVEQKDSFDAVYGVCADSRYELNVPQKDGTLAGLLNFVGQ